MKFTVSAQLTKANPMVDGGLSVGFHTQELNVKDKIIIMDLFNRTGWLHFSEDQLQEIDIPDNNSDFEVKTPSKRLRAVLFLLWKQLGENGKFEDYYLKQMETFIELVKSKLDQ